MLLEAIPGPEPTVQETCTICEAEVPFSVTAHVLVHPNTDAGVRDFYVCRSCYDERVAPLFGAGADTDDDG